jgi:hypothetical protein
LNIPKRILEFQLQMHLLPIWQNIIILNYRFYNTLENCSPIWRKAQKLEGFKFFYKLAVSLERIVPTCVHSIHRR